MREVEIVDIDFNEILNDFKDGAGSVPSHRHPRGGGWVADSAHVDAECYIGPEARVYGNATVSGNARVYDKAQVYGNAYITANARVSGKSKVYGNAFVGDNAMVYGEAEVYENSKIRNNSQVYENSIVRGNADIKGDVKIFGDSIVTRTVISIQGFDSDITITDHHICINTNTIPPSHLNLFEQIDDEWKKLLLMIAEFHGCVDYAG